MKPVQIISSVKQNFNFKLLCLLVVSSVLVACAGNSGKAPVLDRSHAARTPVTSGYYIVKRGDTLYSIAFRYGWDWRALAARNGIRAPYTIVPGQRINFSAGTAVQSTRAVAHKAPAVRLSQPAPAAKAAPKPIASAPKSKVKPASVAAGQQGKWLWPTEGKLISVFSSNTSLNKGVDIAGKLGQSIVATADGSVVYAGSGLRGYGELVIIKHNDTFISAYGHNRRLLVKEGQTVKAGQTIAEMGSTGTDQVKLHFEIRRQGKPVDPMQYLPQR
ncbi:peptidoglycan DD-metalloendopeptidase family protein [Denitrificimonas halotolerans]|uniref:peptidoglycan DD-metalloendopeptidase family protein n=1 Tax=Denitrificimonas halotolerans TaxID=3098930 RepID=UPI0038990433